MAAEGGNRKAGRRLSLAGELVHGLGELDVEFGQPAGIMGRQSHFDIFVDVEPFGVVIEFFRHQRGARHEAEGLIEIGKDEFFGDGISILDLGPAFEPGQRTLARFAGEFLSHLTNSVCAADRGRPAQNFPARSRPAKPHHVGNTASRGEVPRGLPIVGIWPGLTPKLGHKPNGDCIHAHPSGINQSGDLAHEPGLAPWRQHTRHVVGLPMPPGLPHHPLAMRLWLSRRSSRADGTDSAGHSSGRSMSIGSLEHMMRNRFRMFLRHTWLVTILGTIVLGSVVWAAFYYSTKNTVMRIAAGPNNAKIVQVLSGVLARSHDRLQLQLVATD